MTMKNKIVIYVALLLGIALTGCDKEPHEVPTGKPTQEAVVTVTMKAEQIPDAPLNDVHIYWFDQTDQLARHDYYPSMEALARARTTLPVGSYTVMAVLNVGADFEIPAVGPTLPDIDLNAFSAYVKAQECNYADMLTGTVRHTVRNGVQLVYIDLESKSGGIKDASMELLITIPSANLPEFVSARATAPALRGVAYIFKKGSTEVFAVKRATLEATANEGVYKMGVSLFKGEYDVNLWVDYTTDATTDNHYITTHDKGDVIRILDKAVYRANDDSRDAFSKRISLSVKEDGNAPQSVAMHRPLAKYKLVATDVEKYNQMRISKNLPELKDLRVFIGYEGFLPTAYSISEQKPADAEMGYYYNTILSTPTATTVDVAKDFVFVNGTESSVSVTILFKDAAGKIVSGVKGVKIAYRAGHLTTVSGDFLTSGLGSGVDIDTEWDDDIDVEF